MSTCFLQQFHPADRRAEAVNVSSVVMLSFMSVYAKGVACFRQYKTPAFRHRLLKVIRETRISSWLCQSIVPENISIHKVSGAMTNAVFFVSCPPWPGVKTLLLRVYGPSSGTLINRSRELHILHILSSQYRIGPRVYGTFDNGTLSSPNLSHSAHSDSQAGWRNTLTPQH